jgi:ribose 5-phosphate isomerase A
MDPLQTDPLQQFKQAAAEFAVGLVESGMVVGLGTGSTAKLAVEALGKRVQDGLRIVGVPTSEYTARQARGVGIRISSLAEHAEIDLTIDGADEIQRGTLELIKGGGGALLREKVIASSSRRLIIIADESKLVDWLGAHFAVPVEVVQFEWQATERKLKKLGAQTTLRPGPGSQGPNDRPFVTDSGNFIVDCSFSQIAAPAELDQQLNSVVGVVEHGLFLKMTSQAIVAGRDGVKVLLPQ